MVPNLIYFVAFYLSIFIIGVIFYVVAFYLLSTFIGIKTKTEDGRVMRKVYAKFYEKILIKLFVSVISYGLQAMFWNWLVVGKIWPIHQKIHITMLIPGILAITFADLILERAFLRKSKK